MPKKNISGTKQLMGALMRMKPKPHEDMKLGRAEAAAKKKKKRR